MPWRQRPPTPPIPPKPTADPRDRDSTLLMIQWVIWKHLAPKVVIDPEKMQRLAETLASEFYDEGVRTPLTDDPEETPQILAHELLLVGKEVGPVPIPEKHLRERVRKVGYKLYERGWRKIAVVIAVLLPHGGLFIGW